MLPTTLAKKSFLVLYHSRSEILFGVGHNQVCWRTNVSYIETLSLKKACREKGQPGAKVREKGLSLDQSETS